MGEIIYIGSKPVMSYVTAVVMQLNEEDEVTLKARGRAISRAVDCAEIVRNKFIPEIDIANITTGTDLLEDKSGEERNVSTIEIILRK